MVHGRFRTQHHPPEVAELTELVSGFDRALGIIWSIGLIVLVGALIAGAVQVIGEPTAEMGFRWVMALFFLGGSLAWLTQYHRDALRRFFKRQ